MTKVKMLLAIVLVVFFASASIAGECTSMFENIKPFDPAQYAIRALNNQLGMEPSSYEKRDDGSGYNVIWKVEKDLLISLGLNKENRVDSTSMSVILTKEQTIEVVQTTIRSLKECGCSLEGKPEEGRNSLDVYISCGDEMHLVAFEENSDGSISYYHGIMY